MAIIPSRDFALTADARVHREVIFLKIELTDDEFVCLLAFLEMQLTAIANNPVSKKLLLEASQVSEGQLAVQQFKTLTDLTRRLHAMLE